ncbi:unnamed protein product [Moneuplotes crassus]|uniref:V-type proton ATPase proteolipid subunit n=1 Tax=Euplotes crassus TaxID=5936 RepID=A0AAD1XVM5_EUPCR|nr:unnamed protein product [Moneuplotes crassus]
MVLGTIIQAAAVGDEVEAGQAAFFGFMGIASALVFANLGASYGTAKSGVGIASMGVLKPELIFKSIVPVIMAGILGIYGLIISLLIYQKINRDSYTFFEGYKHLASGLCCGLSSLGAGLAIGIVGDAGVRANAQQEAVFVGMILILIFAEALGLYGMIIAIVISQ